MAPTKLQDVQDLEILKAITMFHTLGGSIMLGAFTILRAQSQTLGVPQNPLYLLLMGSGIFSYFLNYIFLWLLFSSNNKGNKVLVNISFFLMLFTQAAFVILLVTGAFGIK